VKQQVGFSQHFGIAAVFLLAKHLDKLFQMIIMLVIFIHINAKDGRFSGRTSNWDLTGRGIYSIRITYQHQPLTATSEKATAA